MQRRAGLMWEDGTLFRGKVNTILDEKIGEIVFNTTIVGYQEILTNTVYANTILILSYPLIARVATKLAVGLTLPEIMNKITDKTNSFFEPSVDYCVLKTCRFTLAKFPRTERVISTSIKAVREAIAIGRNFKEAL